MTYAYQPLATNARHGRSKSMKLRLVLVAALTVVALGILYHWRPRQRPSPFPIVPYPDEHYMQGCASESRTTRYLGGTPGFTVLENVWYNDRTFHFVTGRNETYPDERALMTGTALDIATELRVTPVVCFPGTSLPCGDGHVGAVVILPKNATCHNEIGVNAPVFLNAGASKDWNVLSHYYHFAVENILGGFAALATTQSGPVAPDRVVIPWKADWHDKWAMNDAVVAAVFGREVVEREQWRRLEGRGWIFFEKLVLVDRWAAHESSPLVKLWNKMPLAVFQKAKDAAGFFDTARDRLRAYFHVEPPPPTSPIKHRVTYIDRQRTQRRLRDGDHQSFLDEMRALADDREDVEFAHLVLETMTPAEQFAALAHATVVVGVHGNGLTHVMWMPAGSSVIEIFPPKGFLRDYQCAVEVLGHHYTALRGDEIITKEMWEADPGTKHEEAFGGFWGIPLVEVDVPLLVQQVRKALDRG